jgi:hypothetical protein
MSQHLDNAEMVNGLCASMLDKAKGSTYWRGSHKTAAQAKKDVAAHQNVK